MGKRKEPQGDGAPSNPGDDESSDEDLDILNVEFEWFDPQPETDFHGLKTLCRQLFDSDHQLFNLSELSDLILSQPTLGSTVKVDGKETDPYAFLTVVNLHEHREKPIIRAITEYLAQKALSSATLAPLADLLLPSSGAQVGLILTERFINMPAQIVPPMYTMLLEEIKWAVQDKEPYTFSHYLILSKTYCEVASKLDEEDNRPAKKKKKQAGDEDGETFYFHAEDEVLHKYALAYTNYDYTRQEEGASDSKRAFQEAGIKPQGHLILIDGSKLEEAVIAINDYINAQG